MSAKINYAIYISCRLFASQIERFGYLFVRSFKLQQNVNYFYYNEFLI